MHRRGRASVALVSVGLVLGWAQSDTQSRALQAASLEARAFDGSGQPIPGVFVTAMLATGGDNRTGTTDRQGTARFENLPDGAYRVDFDIQGFDIVRRNHVIVRHDSPAQLSAVLPITPICECVRISPVPGGPEPVLEKRAGQVLDEAGHPLAHARLQLVTPAQQVLAYADGYGRFVVRLPVDQSWPLRASDSGFQVVTRQVSSTTHDPLVFLLAVDSTAAVRIPDAERLSPGCCPSDLITHDRR
jgi:hypothetical protein